MYCRGQVLFCFTLGCFPFEKKKENLIDNAGLFYSDPGVIHQWDVFHRRKV